jgi:hypothetical protein
MLKETYGGLKKFLQRHNNLFTIGTDHDFNPSVQLATPVTLTPTSASASNLDQQQHISPFPFNVNAPTYSQPFFNHTFTQIPQQPLATHQSIYHQQQAQALHPQQMQMQMHMPVQHMQQYAQAQTSPTPSQQTFFPSVMPQAYFMQQQHPYDASTAINQASNNTQYSNQQRS